MSTSVEDRPDRLRIGRALLIALVLAGCGRDPELVPRREETWSVPTWDHLGSFRVTLEVPDLDASGRRAAVWWREQDASFRWSIEVHPSSDRTPRCGPGRVLSRQEVRDDGYVVVCDAPADHRVQVLAYVRDPRYQAQDGFECEAWLGRGTVTEVEAVLSACRSMRIVGYDPRSFAPSSTVELESREQPHPFAGRLTIPIGFERFEPGVPWTVGWGLGVGLRLSVGAWHEPGCSSEIAIELKREVLGDGLLRRCRSREEYGSYFIERVIARDGQQMYCTAVAALQVVESQLRELEAVCKSVEIVAQPARAGGDTARP